MKMWSLLLATLVASQPIVDYGYGSPRNAHSMFQDYIVNYKKDYVAGSDEYEQKFQTFISNIDDIISHNRKEGVTYMKGVNQFTDMSKEEFAAWLKMSNGYDNTQQRDRQVVVLSPTNETSVDWTQRKCGGGSCVTPVKNQQQCGSCWAFSATGCLEARVAILNKAPAKSYSEQQLVDCSKPEGNMGCNGGLMDYAFQYVKDVGGSLCPESFYQYKAVDELCKRNFVRHCNKTGQGEGFHDVMKMNEQQLMAAIAQGPVSVAIEADQSIFQSYKSGVITGMCGNMLDHGVLAVGYGSMKIRGKMVDYWKVKNSWGPAWGDKGYVLLGRNNGKESTGGECGILKDPSYPVLKAKDGEAKL